jgi:hypothetical protein
MSKYSEYFLNSKSSVVQLELLEISHSNFTKVYYIVRNAVNGITVKLEDGTSKAFNYYPLQISPMDSTDDLDQAIKISFGDLGEILPKELDKVSSANGFSEKPIVKYRIYRSDDLENVLVGPFVLEIKTFSFAREGSTFEAKAPSLNINKTGEIYKLDRFPMLRGFL